jgi:hypothetical protein
MAIHDFGIAPTVNGASYDDCSGLVSRGREGQECAVRKYDVDALVVGVGMPEEIPKSQSLYATCSLPFSGYARRSFGPVEGAGRYHSLSQAELVVPSFDQQMIGYSTILQVILRSYLLILSSHHLSWYYCSHRSKSSS